jgi:hypothetical protein
MRLIIRNASNTSNTKCVVEFITVPAACDWHDSPDDVVDTAAKLSSFSSFFSLSF